MSNLNHVEMLTNRYNNLSARIHGLIEWIGNKSVSKFSLRDEIRGEIEKFQNFFSAYHSYFLEPDVIKQYSDQKTQTFVLSKVLEKTVENWSILNKAIDQRYNTSLNPDLEKLDQEARKLYERFEVSGDGNKPITYFGKVFNLTRFPYDAAPLLGVPFDRIGQPDLHDAVAHELGHFVFWNSGNLEEYRNRLITLRQAIAKVFEWEGAIDLDIPQGNDPNTARVSTWLNWSEEVFADVFGTLMRGPAYAKSAQDLQVREQIGELADLVRDDSRHPMPFIRPLVSLATLRVMAKNMSDKQIFVNDLNNLIQKLDERWRPYKDAHEDAVTNRNEIHQYYHNPEDDNHQHEHGVVAVKPRLLRDDVEVVVEKVLQAKLFTKDSKSKSLLECVEYWGLQNAESASKEIEDLLNGLVYDQDSLLDLPPAGTVSQPTLQTTKLPSDPSNSFEELLNYIRTQRKNRSNQLESEEWEDILDLALSSEVGHVSHWWPCDYGWATVEVWHRHTFGGVVLC